MTTLKRIGKGAFTTAYLDEQTQRVTLHSCDPIKEVMGHGWFPTHYLFPEIQMIECGVYEMDYMPAQRSLKGSLLPAQWCLYNILRACADQWTAAMANKGWRHCDSYSELYKVISGNKELSVRFTEEQEAILEALDGCANCGSDIGFEVSPRNVRANSSGQLVLMDVFFSLNTLMKVRGK